MSELDDEELVVSSISNDNLTISNSVAEDGTSLSADVKSVAKILQTILQEKEDKSYILNDEIMQLLESGAIAIDEAVNKYFQERIGQGIEVNTLIDEYNTDLSTIIKEQVALITDDEDVVSLLGRIVNEIENIIPSEKVLGSIESALKETENKILIQLEDGDIETAETPETTEDIFTGERTLFEEEAPEVIDDVIKVAEKGLDEMEMLVSSETADAYSNKFDELIGKAEALAVENPNVTIEEVVEDESVSSSTSAELSDELIVEQLAIKEEGFSSVDNLETRDVGIFISPSDTEVKELIDILVEDGVIGDKLDEEKVVVSLFNYVISQYAYYPDEEEGSIWQPAPTTIRKGGGSYDDQTILFVNLCIAAGVEESNIKVYKTTAEGDLPELLVCGYVTTDGSIVELDLSQREALPDIDATFEIDESQVKVIFPLPPSTTTATATTTATTTTTTSASTGIAEPTVLAYDGTEVVDVRSFVDSDIPEVQQIVELLRTEGIITADMSEDEISVAIYNYVSTNYEYLSDEETGLAWQTAESTINTGGGDCEDLTILFVDLCLAAGVRPENIKIYVEQGSSTDPGHTVAGYSASSGQIIAFDLTTGAHVPSIVSIPQVQTSDYNFSFNADSIEVYSSIGATLVFENPHYEASMYTAIQNTPPAVTHPTMDSIISVFSAAYDTYMVHVNNLINYQQYYYEIPVDLSGVTEETAAFAAGNWRSYTGVDFEGMVDQFLGIQIQIYIMMACVILFNELLDVRKMVISYVFDFEYEDVKVLSPQRISDRFSSEVSNLDQLISMALEDAMDKNQEAYEFNMEEAKRIAKECASHKDKKKRDAYENVLVSHANLLLLQQFSGVNTTLLTSCRAAIAKIGEVKGAWERDNIWQEALRGGSVDSNLRVSARLDKLVMQTQTGYVISESTMDISSLVLKVLFGIDSKNDDRANIAAIDASFRSAEKQWITRSTNFIKVGIQMAENIKLAQKQYDDAVRIWNVVKKKVNFWGNFFTLMVVGFFLGPLGMFIAALAMGMNPLEALVCSLFGALGYAMFIYPRQMMKYQMEILQVMKSNLENDISLHYELLKLDWVEGEYQHGGNQVGEILTTEDMATNFGGQLNNIVANAWGLVQGMGGDIGDLNAQIMAMQIMILSLLTIFDAMSDANGVVLQVLFNIQPKVDAMQVLQTWVTSTFAGISSAFDYNSSMLFNQAQEHNRKLQVEMQLKSVNQQISSLKRAMTRQIISSIVTAASLAAICAGPIGIIVGIIGAIIGIMLALQSMKDAAKTYEFAKQMYQDYKDAFSVGPKFFTPEWLFKGVESGEGNMGVLFQGLNTAMTGALGADQNSVTKFLSQMLAVLAIGSAMLEAQAIILTVLFGVNTGSQSKFTLAGFQAFGAYAMTMISLAAQRKEMQMQVDKILTDALLAIEKAKDQMKSANMYGWISIGISCLSIIGSVLKLFDALAKVGMILVAVSAILQAIASIMQGRDQQKIETQAIQRMKDVYVAMYGLDFGAIADGQGNNSALTSSAFDLVNNSAGGMVVPSAGGRITYDPSVALAIKQAIKNMMRTWTAQIAVFQSMADA
ncbi:MAG: transglutaminase-like domain-containing protein [Candidatus Riflemargulisbacteria bacterium]